MGLGATKFRVYASLVDFQYLLSMGSRFFDKCDTRKDIYISKINVLTYCTVTCSCEST